tara:strand:+ start:242 stop:553 length:312 start_codon:yes stop_codon:yes gene_type:complete
MGKLTKAKTILGRVEAYDFRKTKYFQMTSPYYNYPSMAAKRAAEELRVAELTAPIPYDACDECGKVGRSGNPVTGAMFGNTILFQCQECSLDEIYTELDKENG